MRASQSPAVALRTARARTLARKAGGGKRKQPPPGVPLGAGGPTRVEVRGGGRGGVASQRQERAARHLRTGQPKHGGLLAFRSGACA